MYLFRWIMSWQVARWFQRKEIRISYSISSASARECVNEYNYFHIRPISIGDFFRVIYRIIKCFWKCRVVRRVEVFNHGSANGANWFLEIRELSMEEKRQSFATMTQSCAEIFPNVTQIQKRNWIFAMRTSTKVSAEPFFIFCWCSNRFPISRLVLTREICIFLKAILSLLPCCWWDHEVKSLTGCVTEFLLLTLAINRLLQV